ncbi:angiopoietin-related protein 7-like [Saccostrea echinata]|uniref:angiopoietin-related protein 7-like n=1 Tax=Saccostrea echinata TaxID=191078 RepID=UPI002A83E3AE|nr:angiopoietin-related protein 7-like [Saccostrea echinata]
MMNVYSGLYATSVFVICLSVTTNADSCSYNFDVWYPDRDTQSRLQVIELKISNLSSYVDLEILKLKHADLQELKCMQNKSNQLELELIKSKLNEQKEKAANNESFQLGDLNLRLNNFARRLTQLESKLLRRSGRKSRLKQERALEDNGHVTLNTLRASVSDLKSEWIMIKRDMFDIHKEIAYLKRDHNDVTNLTKHLQDTTAILKKSVNNFKASLDHSSQTVRILNSNFDTLKQIVSTKDDAQMRTELKKISTKVGDIEKQLDTYKLNASSLTRAVEKIVLTAAIQNNSAVPMKTPDINRMYPSDCDDVLTSGHSTNGVYRIQPQGSLYPFNVYCDFFDGNFVVFQRREDGLQSFDRSWLEYKFGFGSLYGDFWLGNELIYLITKQRKYGLLIMIEDWEGKSGWAEYSKFQVEDQSNQYTLRVSGYTGNAGDSLTYHSGMKFSTEDTDNDLNMRNCAAENRAGWWFDSCYLSNLNGVYHKGWYTHAQAKSSDGVVWFTWKDSEKYSLKKVQMKLKRA